MVAYSYDGRQRRRRHSDEFKAAVVAQCRRRGVSIASVALQHGLNANLLRRWLTQAEARTVAPGSLALAPPESGEAAGEFLALQVLSPNARGDSIQIEVRCNELTVRVSWPTRDAQAMAVWLRDLLR